MFTYKIGRINPPFYVINLIFYDKDIKYNLEIDIDFINDYKKYLFIDKSNNKYLTAKNKNPLSNNNIIIGDIIIGDIISIENKNTAFLENNYYIKNRIEYKKSSQYEYDKYQFCIGETNSNAKLYKYIYEYMIELFKNDNINNIEAEYIESIIKETSININSQRVLII